MATKHPQLATIKRAVIGRKVKKLRSEGFIPVNLYGKGLKSVALQVGLKEFTKIHKQVGETGLVMVSVGKEQKAALVHNVQVDPVSGYFLHAELRQVDLAQKITAQVPVKLTGEAPAEKTGGVLVQLVNEIEVEALPEDLPDELVADVSSLEAIDQALTVKDLQYDKAKVKLQVDDSEMMVAKVEPPQKEEVEAKPAQETPAEEAEGEEGEAKEEAGDTQVGAGQAKPDEGGKPEEKKKEEVK